MLILLEDEEWGTWADREIARRCAVDNKTVARLREELSPKTEEILSEPAPRIYQDRHGNVTRMDTARIGRKAAEPSPSAPAEAEPAELPPAPEPVPPVSASNVLELGPRLKVVPSPEQIEPGIVADAAAAEIEVQLAEPVEDPCLA